MPRGGSGELLCRNRVETEEEQSVRREKLQI